MKPQGRGGAPGDWLFLALAHHRLGKGMAARERLDQSIKLLDGLPATKSARNPFSRQVPWELMAELQMLCQEAEALLKEGML